MKNLVDRLTGSPDVTHGVQMRVRGQSTIQGMSYRFAQDECEHLNGGCTHDRDDDALGTSLCTDCGKRWPFPNCGMTDEQETALEAVLADLARQADDAIRSARSQVFTR